VYRIGRGEGGCAFASALLDVRQRWMYALCAVRSVQIQSSIMHEPCHSTAPHPAPPRARHLCGAPSYNTPYVSCVLRGLRKDMCIRARHIRPYPFWVKSYGQPCRTVAQSPNLLPLLQIFSNFPYDVRRRDCVTYITHSALSRGVVVCEGSMATCVIRTCAMFSTRNVPYGVSSVSPTRAVRPKCFMI
jgi:hypothetical protein